ncbi:MAG: hypothetical protein AUK47_08095 [Deltaproteobacteria bacterium CG2_30_63_29]|nr:MAG: hypothetical protein AUK47_08095 [Deltaproteobacteria bacterium CG2_30_63_29]PIW02228.1 MAG: hypothetical protein COW42_02465 [Deltaproteobacteria bacterium CG17_big_fil_post_rev_8_21_14_2_50_63_7]PJB43334.1 MAG: hypothetical protein CO108_10205 [Deltaproteobacteria bacterium CG_4_9_14_3_um_filter_63_12]
MDFDLERYETIEMLGRGGFGVVYKATQLATGQLCAIKTLDLASLPPKRRQEQLDRFTREMKLIGQLRSPHVVRLLDFGIKDEDPFMVLEYLEGEELQDYIDRGPMAPADVQRILGQVLEALGEAHAHGIVHRDLKPANIMITRTADRFNAKVLDFGLAGIDMSLAADGPKGGITLEGQIRGTPSHMAPEQLQFLGKSGPGADLYAIGLILLECLTGEPAVTGPTLQAICLKQATMPLEIPDRIAFTAFGPVIEKACQKKPELRYQSASEMLEAIEKIDVSGVAIGEAFGITQGLDETVFSLATNRIAEGDSIEIDVVEEAPVTVVVTAPKRNRLDVVLVLLVLLVLGVALFIAFRDDKQEPNPSSNTVTADSGQSAPVPAAQLATPEPKKPSLIKDISPILKGGRAAMSSGLAGARELIDPTDKMIDEALARARKSYNDKHYEEALAYYQTVLELANDEGDYAAQAYDGMGWTFISLERFADAVGAFTQAVDLFELAGTLIDRTLFGLGISYEGNGQLEEAIQTYTWLLERFPDTRFRLQVEMKLQDLKRELDFRKAKQDADKKARQNKKRKRPPAFGK